jgi:SAM-dependent methyltransferase
MTAGDGADDLLAEQQAYYRARAPEYDDWWERRGRYDRGREHTRAWNAEIDSVLTHLARFDPTGDVLELAAGTGNWTRHLAARADRVTAVDGSREVLEINAAKLGEMAGKVDYVLADLFTFRPTPDFDAVVMGFWLTHVPDDHVDRFWQMVRGALRPGGRVFVVDNAHPRHQDADPDPHVAGRAGHVTTRDLADGRTFDIVKRYWEPAELTERLARLGWAVDTRLTGRFFLVAEGGPA